MRIAVIGHTYIIDANRGKLRSIARVCDDFLLITPPVWMEKDFGERRYEKTVSIPGVALPISHSGHARKYRYDHDLLTAALRRFSPDIIHVEAEAGSLAALQATWISWRMGKKLTQFCWENIPAPLGLKKNLMWLNLHSVDHIFCGSCGAATTVKIDGYRGNTSVVAQVGIDPFIEQGDDDVREFGEKAFTVGFVGRLDEKKGVFNLIRALKDFSDSSINCTIIGDGPARQRLEKEIADAGMPERVRVVGAVPHRRIAAHIRGLDALVLPSRTTPGWKEQFGHVLALGMACGVPVIGSNSGAIPEVIGNAGIIVAEGDARGLADAIASLANSKKKRIALIKAGRKRAADNFTDEAIAGKMLGVWEKLLRESKAEKP